VYDHLKNDFLKRNKNGSFSRKEVTIYARDFLENNAVRKSKTENHDAMDREKLREIKLRIGIINGELVPLSAEIKKRVAVFQAIKRELIYSKSSVFRELREIIRQHPPEGDLRKAVIQIVADLYVKAVHEVMDDIARRNAASQELAIS
jgi:hypothetical protein